MAVPFAMLDLSTRGVGEGKVLAVEGSEVEGQRVQNFLVTLRNYEVHLHLGWFGISSSSLKMLQSLLLLSP